MISAPERPIVQVGQELRIRWREAKKDHAEVYKFLTAMKLTIDNNGNPYASAFCTYFSDEGISVYIVRGYNYGGDMEAFIPSSNVNWKVYFEPLNNFVMSYGDKNKHYSKIFPQEFLPK